MAIYKIQPFANTALALGISSGNVCLLNDTGSSDQRWIISSLGTKVAVQSKNSGYLNADSSTSNCDISSTLISYVTFKKTTENVYRIQLWNNGIKYLTCDGTTNGSNVSWKTSTGGSNQLWALIEEPFEKRLDMPANRLCNWNQFYSGITSQLNGATNGCTITTALDLVNFYGPDSYTMADIKNAWLIGFSWTYPWPGYFGVRNRRDVTGQEAFAGIRTEIISGRPVIVNIGTDSDNHTVMCYGYTNGGTANEDFLVMDPARLTGAKAPDTTTREGVERNLAESIRANDHPEGIWSIRPTRLK